MSLRKRIRRMRRRAGEPDSKRSNRARQKAREKAAAERQKAIAKRERPARDAKSGKGAAAKPSVAKASASKTSSSPPASKKKPRRRLAGDLRKLGGAGVAVVVELLKLVREMLVIPTQLWLGVAEAVGAVVLAAWMRILLPVLRATLRLARALLRLAERHVTPARAVTVVSLVAIGALIASQWRDYSAISVGTDAYSGEVGVVAPPPQVSSAVAHDAHGWVMLVLAALALIVVARAVTKRPRVASLLVPIGIAVLAISIGIDAPKGLDEGNAAIAYESASARLLEGFWLQIATGAVLVACGLLLPSALRPARAAAGVPAEQGPSLIAKLVAGGRASLERRRSRTRRRRNKPTAKGKVQGAGT
jgi:hypothetical protein